MARSNVKNELSSLISRLQAERRQHEQAIADIDRTFSEFGIKVESGGRGGRRGRPPKAAGAVGRTGRRKRVKLSTTAEEDVINFVKQANKPTTADINAFWKKRGRGGKADNTITKLVKSGKLKRNKLKGQRGSTYSVR